MILNFEKEIHLFEKKGQWTSVLDMLWESYLHSKDDLNVNLHLALELWYIISYKAEDYIKNDEIEDLYKKIYDVYQNAKVLFAEDFLYNLFFGYMMIVAPYYFMAPDDDYDSFWQYGYRMCEKARSIKPTDPIAILFCAQKDYDDNFLRAKEKNTAFINEAFPLNSGAVNNYFRDVLLS